VSTAKQRRAAAHRKLEKQLERRQELERQRKQQLIVLSLVAVVAVIGLVTWFAVASSDDKTTTATGCGFVADSGSPAVGMPLEDEGDLQTTGTVDLAMDTTRGNLQIELDRAGAPCAVASFEHLAKAGFFDNTICHRLTTGSFGVLQCGDPTGSGTGGPGYHFNEEPPTGDDPYPAGAVAMANSGSPGSTGSQFFICYTSCSSLPPDYSLVGKVTEGLEVVEEIGAAGTDNGTSDGAPAEEVMITSLAVA
jgi:peptidyl-prolyl cis-trans isomerase B (cyclophilin B)